MLASFAVSALLSFGLLLFTHSNKWSRREVAAGLMVQQCRVIDPKPAAQAREGRFGGGTQTEPKTPFVGRFPS